jgi:phenylacetate-CoA ligase
MKNLFTDGVEYSDALRVQMNDVNRKMEDEEYASVIKNGGVPKRLKYIMEYAVENTSFYSKYAGATRLDEFPVVNKRLLNENYEDVMVHAFDGVKTHKMHTSGSTGIPFTVIQNLEKRERHIADLKYFGALAGYADHNPMCYLRAKPTATPEEQERDNIWQLDISNMSDNKLTDYYHVMVEKKCTALMAYPSTLETSVDFWSKTFVNDSMVKTIISTSEILTNEVRRKLKNFFGDDAGIYARYSDMELGILGQETDVSGQYKLNWASYYFEILKLESDEKAQPGELGRIVITDLYNEAFPMIRYDTGDVARMNQDMDGGLPILTDLYGRRMDLLYDTKGKVVSPHLISRTMCLSQKIKQWQFIQETKDTYTLRVTANIYDKPNVDKEIQKFKEILGGDANILVEYVENIPVMNSLKRKVIVSKLAN